MRIDPRPRQTVRGSIGHSQSGRNCLAPPAQHSQPACISSFSGVHPEDGIGKVIIWGDYSVAAAPRKDMSSRRGCRY